MLYKVIGLMSGSSLDGLDIAYVHLQATRGQWSYTIEAADCIPYSDEWTGRLRAAQALPVPEFLRLHTAYGRYLGEAVNTFIATHSLEHRVDFIASHGHTAFHDPAGHATFQLGDGASIAATVSLPVISDLRSLDVALHGQGAPIVPIGDKLLFGEYDAWLNLGGIANITIRNGEDITAFDITPCNQILNALASRAGLSYDKDGELAAKGSYLSLVAASFHQLDYFRQSPPKSLSNEYAHHAALPLFTPDLSTEDCLATASAAIAQQIAETIKEGGEGAGMRRMLVTGGGALNTFLIQEIMKALAAYNWIPEVPDATTVQFKEAVVMALIGTLRWREENNVYASVTGASRDSIGGALWMGSEFAG